MTKLQTLLASGALAAGLLAAPANASVAEMEKAGWTLVTASDDTWVFMRPAGAVAGDVRRVWTAYDSEKTLNRDGFKFRSVRSLGEYDCRRKMSRVLDEFFHDGAGLTGRTWRSPMFRATPWAVAEPNSVGAMRMAFACRVLIDTQGPTPSHKNVMAGLDPAIHASSPMEAVRRRASGGWMAGSGPAMTFLAEVYGP